MKKIFYVSLLIAFITGSCIEGGNKFPQGAWKLVQSQALVDDSLKILFPVTITGTDIKIWSESHFSAMGRYMHDTILIESFGAGTYKLEGNRYEESYLLHYKKKWVGQKMRMLMEIRNDTLIQTYPVDNNYQLIKNGYSIEKYVRID